ATLWFNIGHYAVRPWAWIVTALASVVLYPNLVDPEVGYIKVWVDYLPGALRGLMLAADRKSTRLNSSHVSISYAVFCVKKKTSLPGLPIRPAVHPSNHRRLSLFLPPPFPCTPPLFAELSPYLCIHARKRARRRPRSGFP